MVQKRRTVIFSTRHTRFAVRLSLPPPLPLKGVRHNRMKREKASTAVKMDAFRRGVARELRQRQMLHPASKQRTKLLQQARRASCGCCHSTFFASPYPYIYDSQRRRPAPRPCFCHPLLAAVTTGPPSQPLPFPRTLPHIQSPPNPTLSACDSRCNKPSRRKQASPPSAAVCTNKESFSLRSVSLYLNRA